MPTAPAVVLADTTASSFQRRQAVRDLMRDPPPDAIAMLAGAFADEDAYLRREVIQAFDRLADPAALPTLRQALADADDYVAREAAEVLGHLGDATDQTALQGLAETASFSLASTAKRAAEQIGKRLASAPAPVPAAVEPEPAPEPTVESAESEPEQSEPEVAQSESEESASDSDAVASESAAEPVESEPAPEPEVEPAADPEPAADSEATPESEPTAVPAVEEEPAPEADAEVEPETEPAAPTAPDPVAVPPAAAVVSDLPKMRDAKSINWATARRHRLFCPDRIDAIEAAYTARWAAEAELPAIHHRWLELTGKLSWERADKDDDIGFADEAVTSAAKALAAAKERQRHLASRLRQHRRNQESMLTGLVQFFSAARRAEAEEHERDLKREQRDAEDLSEQAEEELVDCREALDDLRRPLAELGDEVEQLAARREELEGQIEAADQRIHEVLIHTMEAAPDLASRLDGLAAIGVDRAYLQHCWTGLQGALARDRQLADELADLEEAVNGAQQQATDRGDALGDAFSRGFVVHSEPRETSVRVDASIRFEEERGFFGYRNAGGSARGNGSATVRYDVDTVRWVADEEIQETVDHYRSSWSDLGQLAAQAAAVARQHRQAEAEIREYVWFLQQELARDFEEHGDGR